MGFSVSGAAAIIFASMFIAFGVWFTATSNSFDQITDAQDVKTSGTLDQANTAIEVAATTYDADAGENGLLSVEANNTGVSSLSLEATTLLVDGELQRGWEADATVEGDSTTDLWLSGETLTISVEFEAAPDRVKLVTETGVAVTAEVVEV